MKNSTFSPDIFGLVDYDLLYSDTWEGEKQHENIKNLTICCIFVQNKIKLINYEKFA